MTLPKASLLLSVLLGMSWLVAEPKVIALVTDKPSTKGIWSRIKDHEALKLGAGVVLEEYIGRAEGLRQLDWLSTAGTSGIVRSGLYIFQSVNPWQQWRELIQADLFVDFDVSEDGRFSIEIHSQRGTREKEITRAFLRPKEATASLIKFVFESAGEKLGESMKTELSDPETKEPNLFLAWAAWIGYSPNFYNDNPWSDPNKSAADIISGDPKFVRGMAWALPIRLKPIMSRSTKGTIKKRPANPVDFDNHVLSLLDTRYALLVIPGYQKRLDDPHLFQDSLKILAATEIHFEPADAEAGDEDLLGVTEVKAVEKIKSTPLIRSNVCLALSGNKNQKAIETLLTVLSVDETVIAREAAAEALGGWSDNEEIIESLDKASSEDEEVGVRLSSYKSLAKIKALSEERLTRALDDKSAAVKSFAFSWLAGQKGTSQRVQKLVLAAINGQEIALRLQALGIAGSVFNDDKSIQPALKNALSSSTSDEQLAALNLVRHFRTPELVGAVEGLLEDDSEAVRSLAVKVTLLLEPGSLDKVLLTAGGDKAEAVQSELAHGIGLYGNKKHKGYLQHLLESDHRNVRHAASNAIYRIAADDRSTTIRSMLVDPSTRVNFAAIRLISKLKDKSLTGSLVWSVENHANEYVRTRSLKSLDKMDHPAVHDLCMKNLSSPFWVVRIHAADILTRRSDVADAPELKKALDENDDPWLKLVLEDAICRSKGRPIPERIRLRLGKRKYLEGGERPNGMQLWLGEIPEDSKEARRLVDEGYRFGRVFSAPKNNSMWAMGTWEDSKGKMDAYLLHIREQIGVEMEKTARFLNHLMFFDEPHHPGGGNGQDRQRAFLLEYGRPDLLEGSKKLPPDVSRAFSYWQRLTTGELSNFIVKLTRITFGRKYPDLKFFPQTMSYYGGATVDIFDKLDTDGDYSWRYDNSNIFGHYSKTAVMRAIHPDQPVSMVTWMGWIRPARFTLDRVFTDTKYPAGPWRPRSYVGSRAALAMYIGGSESGFFNHVGYDPISARGKDIGGLATWEKTPFSAELAGVIDKRMLGGDRAIWEKKRKAIEGQVTAEMKPAKTGDPLEGEEEEAEADEIADFIDEAEGTKRVTIEDVVIERYEAERNKSFMNAMLGCSWMNIFNCDVTRAMANLPRPKNPTQETLLILARGNRFNGEGATFVMPAIALCDGFDMCPTFDCVRLTDLNRYDTIMLLDGVDGVTSLLVKKINAWLRSKENGFLYVSGDLNTSKSFFPELVFDKLEENFLWEGKVQPVASATVEEDVLDRHGKKTGKTRTVPARLPEFQASGKGSLKDRAARLRFTWEGEIEPLLSSQGKTILARWKAPDEVKSVVVFEGVTEAGPVYTQALEKIILHLDKMRSSRVKRNRHWGHLSMETDQFIIQVATSGYRSLQSARPRQLSGVDIITGVINPIVKHSECALVLKDYVGPYAGGKGDWAVMAASELKEMKVVDERILRILSRGVTRVTHIGDTDIKLRDEDAFVKVENQVYVWEKMWEGKKAFSVAEIPGGRELHFSSEELVEVFAIQK